MMFRNLFLFTASCNRIQYDLLIAEVVSNHGSRQLMKETEIIIETLWFLKKAKATNNV
jgi:hypothetical protein